MQVHRSSAAPLLPIVPVLSLVLCLAAGPLHAARIHIVTLGAVRKVPYTPPEASADTRSEEATTLRVRPLLVDDKPREWTVGDLHEVTDRTFVIRRAFRINDALPGEGPRWTWQPGPWLQVDRTSGRVAPVHLPNFDTQISEVTWFRDYAAYCGLSTGAKGGVVAVVAELGGRKAVAQHTLAGWPLERAAHPVCALAQWQRTPMRATLSLTGGQPITFDVAGTSSLIEEGEGDEE